MKNKTYIKPQSEIIKIVFESHLLTEASTRTMDYGGQFSAGEQYSQKKEQESIWDGMSDE